MKASKEVAMALMEELLQQHNPVNLLRCLSEEQEQLPPPLLLKTSKCSFPNQGHTQAEKILLPAVLWNFLHSGKNAQEKTNNGRGRYKSSIAKSHQTEKQNHSKYMGKKEVWVLILQKGIKCERKETTCYYVQGKANGLQGTPQKTMHLLAGAQCARAGSAQVKKKGPRKLGVRV